VNDFRKDLAFSENASNESFWQDIYEVAFPSMVCAVACSGDTASQRLGIDRLVHLSSGRTLRIDEKVRRVVYEDILIEYLSNDVTGAPGWIEKELQIDYLAYAFLPTETVYLLPWDLLRRAWRRNKNNWLNKYKTIRAQNPGYVTLSVAVPIRTLRIEVANASMVRRTP
jgi:hypothetical protein